jgi:hypothetical protein
MACIRRGIFNKKNSQNSIYEGDMMEVGLWVVLAVAVPPLVWAIAIYNGLVRLRALVREGFSGITVQLRRRADLIPNLVSTVQGYASHEREALDDRAQPRLRQTEER